MNVFLAAFAHALEHTGGYSPAQAKRMAGTLLRDVLSYDPTRPASFPDNGRRLSDDAFDSFIRILTNGKPSCRSLKLALVWCLAVALWRDCRVSWEEDVPLK